MLLGLSVLLDGTSENMPYGQQKATRACHFNGGKTLIRLYLESLFSRQPLLESSGHVLEYES
jgi:hypothetical protein